MERNFPQTSQKAAEVDGKTFPPHTILRSNLEFEQGKISGQVFLGAPEDCCVVLLPAEVGISQSGGTATDPSNGAAVEFELAFGLNILGAPYGFAGLRNWNWEPIVGVGQGSSAPIQRWVDISAHVSGSDIDLFIDGVRVLSTSRKVRRGQIGLFMQGNGRMKFRNLTIDGEQPACFVIMQFSADFNFLYTDVIKPVCQEFGYRVVRGDDFNSSGQILDDITSSIRSAALVIADITPDNPNVFYEVGYAHGISKSTILLSDRRREKLPFDVSGFRTLFYDNSIGGKAVVESRLRQHLEALRRGK